MHKKNISADVDVKQIIKDILSIIVSVILSFLFYNSVSDGYINIFDYIWMFILHGTIFILCMHAQRMYNFATFYYIDRIIQKTLISSVVSVLSIGTLVFLSKSIYTSRLLFGVFELSTAIVIILQRIITRCLLKENIGNGYTHIMFIGNQDIQERYIRFVHKSSSKVKVDKFIASDDAVMENILTFENLLKNSSVDEIVFVYDKDSKKDRFQEMMKVCEDMGLTVRVVFDVFEFNHSKSFITSVGTLPVIVYHSISFNKLALFIKATTDVVCSLIGIIILLPVFLITAIAIKYESPGPVLFTQIRIGQNGKPFKMYKFRSMYRDAEERKKELMKNNQVEGGYMFKLDDDPRITKVGAFIRRTSIDELPQLFNVLLQNMSLVGTRPPTPDEVEKYRRDHWRRISIKPGITGMWQTSGRSDILDFEEVVALDTKYIDEWSLALDIKLLFKTVIAVFTRKGAR